MSAEQSPNPAATPPRKRRRPPKSCEPCRRRKVRCDLELPCNQCRRSRNKSEQCFYRTESRLEHVEAQLEQSAQGKCSVKAHPLGSFPEIEPAAPTIASSETSSREGRDVDSEPKSLPHHPPRAGPKVNPLQPNELWISTPVAQEHAGRRNSAYPRIKRRLRVSPEKTRIFEQTHWLHAAEELRCMGGFDAKTVEPSIVDRELEFKTMMMRCRRLRAELKAQRSVRLNDPMPEWISTLPDREVCDELVRAYIRTFELLFRILHIPSFWNEYEAFWAEPGKVKPAFSMIMRMVLAIGSTFAKVDENFDSLRRLARTWIFAAQWWLSGPTEKTTMTLDGLRVFCLLIIARRTNSVGDSPVLSADSLLGMAMRMGLHINTVNFPGLPPFLIEVRRRLWATVAELSLQSSIDSGQPVLLSGDGLDYPLPANLNDVELDPDATKPNEASTPDRVTQSSVQRLLFGSFHLRLRAARLLTLHHEGQPYEEILKLSNELRGFCRQVAAFFHSCSTANENSVHNEDTKGNPLPGDFHRKVLVSQLHNLLMLLHRPFMLQAKDDPRFYLSRKTCLECCLIMMSTIEGLDVASGEMDDYAMLVAYSSSSLRGPVSLGVIVTLSYELHIQISEQLSEGQPTFHDPLDELSRAQRAPIVRKLEHIRDQAFAIIARGNPSMMRYALSHGILAHLKAVESGQPSEDSVMVALREALNNSLDAMETYRAATTPPDDGSTLTGITLGNADGFMDMDPVMEFNFENLDPNFGFDFTTLLSMPNLGTGDGGSL